MPVELEVSLGNMVGQAGSRQSLLELGDHLDSDRRVKEVPTGAERFSYETERAKGSGGL